MCPDAVFGCPQLGGRQLLTWTGHQEVCLSLILNIVGSSVRTVWSKKGDHIRPVDIIVSVAK